MPLHKNIQNTKEIQMIKNATIMEFDKQGKKVNILFDSDTPAGIVHDCLMEAKDRMVQAQKQEEEISEQYKKLQVEEEGKDHGDKCC